jgi:hypothetical protein
LLIVFPSEKGLEDVVVTSAFVRRNVTSENLVLARRDPPSARPIFADDYASTCLLSPSQGVAAWSASGGLSDPKNNAHMERCAVIGKLDIHAAACERCAHRIQQTTHQVPQSENIVEYHADDH